MSRKIAVITGTRAEYGLLSGSLRELRARGAELQLIVTGAHLSRDHGYTVEQIEADGFPIAAKVDMQLTSDESTALAHSMGLALGGIADALARLKPDIAVILGDRYEMLAAASACAIMRVPIAHIHGGEVTEGALDESIRHAITKLSYWHFATAEPYAQRILQLGEDPARVFTVGAPGIDALAKALLPREELSKELGVELTSPVLLITLHPETLSATSAAEHTRILIDALNDFRQATLLITGANADAGGRVINDALSAYANTRANAVFRMSFGSKLYLSAMRACDVVVGNSSSAVIEAPSIPKPAVNIGDRQKGRLRPPSVVDCAFEKQAIVAAINTALALHPAQNGCFGVPGQVAPKIATLLLELPLPDTIRKAFHDLT